MLANLFKYNDYSQTLLSIYSDIKDGSLSLTEGQKVISTALNFDEQENNNAVTNEKNHGKQPAAPASVDLLDYDSVVTASPAKPAAVAPSPAKPVVTQSNIDLDFFSAPVAQPAPVSSTNTFSPAPVSVPATSAAPPAPLNKAPSSSIPRLAPPPTGKIPFLAPPPKAGSTVRSNSISESPAKPVAPQPAVTTTQVPASSSSGLLDFDPFGSNAPIVSTTPMPAAPVAPVAPAHVPNQPFQPFAGKTTFVSYEHLSNLVMCY